MMINDDLKFAISLSVLNHLWRQLYRSFTTVLGEAVSNAWDAEADNVEIIVDKENWTLLVMDDGNGMSKSDFENKFLKIWYSKRKEYGERSPNKDRPYIGRKWIGKLAMLSCAQKITVISKTEGGTWVGWVIDNSWLDEAIQNDLTPQDYVLWAWDEAFFAPHLENKEKWTIIFFESVNDGIRNSEELLRKTIALYFRFALRDPDFKISLNGTEVTMDDLEDLASKTEFLWTINGYGLPEPWREDEFISDIFLSEKLTALKFPEDSGVPSSWKDIPVPQVAVKWFVASVSKPRDLSILGSQERVNVDLFVNGRLREKDILKHFPSNKIVENYLYGQIHFDVLDTGETDRLTSSREWVIADDPLFAWLVKSLKEIVLPKVVSDWDKWRLENGKEWDDENPSVSKRDRRSKWLYNAVADEYSPDADSPEKSKIDSWIKSLGKDAEFNFSSYAECFISENLIRKYLVDKEITVSAEAIREIEKWKRVEDDSKNLGNLSIDIRQNVSDLSYLDMKFLAALADKHAADWTQNDRLRTAFLLRDSETYKPMRDALAHTSLLTAEAKARLTSVYENIRARLKKLISW